MFGVRLKIVPLFLIVLFTLVTLAACAPATDALPESSPEILSLDAKRIDGGERMRYEWEVDPNGSTADTWLGVWTGDPQRPEIPQGETWPFSLDECDNEDSVTCHSDSRVTFAFILDVTTGEEESGTTYYQVYVGNFGPPNDFSTPREVEVSSDIRSHAYP